MSARFKPVLGFPNCKEAIIALYEQGVEPRQIAKILDTSVNYVSSKICYYRKKTGRYVKPVKAMAEAPPITQEIWIDDEDKRRMKFYNKARKGAKMALEMMNAE